MPKQSKSKPTTESLIKAQAVISSPQVTSLQSILVMMAALLITIIGLRYIAMDLIAPILLALFFTILMMPFFQWFRKRGYSRGVSLFLMIGTLFLSLALFVIFFHWSLGLISASLEETFAAFRTNVATTTEALGLDTSSTTLITDTLSPETVASVVSMIASSMGNLLYFFVIIPILSILILMQVDSIPKDVTDKMVRENNMIAKMTKFASSVIVYVSARFKVNLLTGIMFTVALYFLGIEFALVWGILAVFLSFIPYIGLIIAAFPPVFLAFVSGGLVFAIIVGLVLIGINLFVENVVDPYVQGKESKLSTASVVIALIFWTWLLGFVGAILSVPLTVLLKTVLADYKETQWIALLMEGQYKVTPESKAGQKNLISKITGFFGKEE